jgi:hypothetical protein
VNNEALSNDDILLLINDMNKGNTSEKNICVYGDYLLTSINPNSPDDATKVKRDDYENYDLSRTHACSKC